MNRRTFLESTVKASTGTFVGLNCLYPVGRGTMKNGFSATIPLPIQVVIDDVGWWSGYDGSKHQEPFRYNAEAITNKYFGFDADVLTINRGRDLLEWNVIGIPPVGELKGPTCGMHWANFIHPDPERNLEIVKEWGQFLAPYDTREDTMLAADSGCFQNQLLYHEGTVISKKRNSILFDFSKLRSFPGHKVRNEFTLKIKGNDTLLFKSESMKIQVQLNSTPKKEYLYTLTLQRELSNANSSLDILFE